MSGLVRLTLALVALMIAASGGIILSIERADAHPGNTDSSGCHTCRTNCTERWGIPYGYYHRHNPVRDCFVVAEPVATNPPEPKPEQVPSQSEQPTADESSDVAAVAIVPADEPPSAGFGPGDTGTTDLIALIMAGLTGAGIAWASAGLAGLRVARSPVRSAAPPPRPEAPARLEHAEPERSIWQRLPASPPLVVPAAFRPRTRR